MKKYELHPLCTLFPRLSAAELEALSADILANGQREPITIHEGLILDGGNRYQACVMAGVEPLTREFEGGNLVSFVLSANLHRRHLSAGQQAAIVASAQDWARAQTVGNPSLKTQSGNLAPLQTVADRAAQSGASERTQKMADKVAKADPELAREVAHGKKSLPQAIEQITGKRPGAKPAEAIPDLEDDGPSAEEIADAERAAREDEERVRLILDSDNALEAMTEKCKQLQAENAALRSRVGGLQGELAQAIRMVKMWRGKAEKVAA